MKQHHLVKYLKFPMVLGCLGMLFSSREWIIFLGSLSPPAGLLVYYFIIFLAILFLQHIGLIIADMPFDSVQHAIGTLLIIFSFFIVFDWTSYYINQVTTGSSGEDQDSPPKISNIYLQSEDGSVYYFWYNIMKLPMKYARIMTYLISPFVLSVLGMYFIRGSPLRWSPL